MILISILFFSGFILILIAIYNLLSASTSLVPMAELEELKKLSHANQLEAALTKQQAEEEKAAAVKLKVSLEGALEQVRAKENELQKLNEQLERMQHEQGSYETTLAGLKKAESDLRVKLEEMKKLSQANQLEVTQAKQQAEEEKAAAAKLKISLDSATEQAKAKDVQIQKLTEQLASVQRGQGDYETKAASLKGVESDLVWLEKTIAEQKRNSHELKQRIEEDKVKLGLLREKTKEGVELIAQFAQGKEFDEFRKTIHLDEIVEKYENEIKALRIKNIELSKRLEAKGSQA